MKALSSQKLASELDVFRSSVQRILKDDLELWAYKIRKEPLLTDEHKQKRMKFANWIPTNFRKESTMNTRKIPLGTIRVFPGSIHPAADSSYGDTGFT